MDDKARQAMINALEECYTLLRDGGEIQYMLVIFDTGNIDARITGDDEVRLAFAGNGRKLLESLDVLKSRIIEANGGKTVNDMG